MAEQSIPPASPGGTLFDRLSYAAAVLSGLVLASMVLLTVADVTLRFAAEPIYGSQEMTELGMVALIMLALPYCSATDSHIRVDLLDNRLGRRGRWLTDLFAASVGLVVLSCLVWNTAYKVADVFRYDDVTNLLQVPLWPIYALIALSMAAYGLANLKALVVLMAHRVEGNE
jgi:TRAP-type C4-dicarboxylate transport system permease small subunit